MQTSNMVDRYSHILWVMLLAVGVLLTIVGWMQFVF